MDVDVAGRRVCAWRRSDWVLLRRAIVDCRLSAVIISEYGKVEVFSIVSPSLILWVYCFMLTIVVVPSEAAVDVVHLKGQLMGDVITISSPFPAVGSGKCSNQEPTSDGGFVASVAYW